MRLKTALWVSAYLRRCQVEGAAAVVRRRGAEEAGAVFIRICRLDGTSDLFGPAPQSEFDAVRDADRAFSPSLKERPAPDAAVEPRPRCQNFVTTTTPSPGAEVM